MIPVYCQMWTILKFLWNCKKRQENVQIKTTGLAHNFIIPANCWNPDWGWKSNGSMSYGVHKVTPMHGTDNVRKIYKFSWHCKKVKGNFKIKTTGLEHNFTVPANCWNHHRRSKSNGSMSYGVHKKVFRTHGRTVVITTRPYRRTPGDNHSIIK